MLRSTRKQSIGAGAAPTAFIWKRRCSSHRSLFVRTAPPITSECPPRYFVVECIDKSAPRASGCWRYGEAKVLSTATSTSEPWAMSHSASISTMRMSGFVGVSIHMSFVSGRSASSAAWRSVMSMKLNSTPYGSTTCLNRRTVPPYRSFIASTWSPGRSILRIASMAATPEAKQMP